MYNFRTLRKEEITVKADDFSEAGCKLFLYLDARAGQMILDETVGAMNWQRSQQLLGRSIYCTVEIWDDAKKQWVGKQDVGSVTDIAGEKGQASDAFKRACINWGIGRELYTTPKICLSKDLCTIESDGRRFYTRDQFLVSDLAINEEHVITRLEIVNLSAPFNGVVVYQYDSAIQINGTVANVADIESAPPADSSQSTNTPVQQDNAAAPLDLSDEKPFKREPNVIRVDQRRPAQNQQPQVNQAQATQRQQSTNAGTRAMSQTRQHPQASTEAQLIRDDEVILMGNCRTKKYGAVKDTQEFREFLQWALTSSGKYPDKERSEQFIRIKQLAQLKLVS